MTKRSVAAALLLPFVTFGIYSLYWCVRTKTEMNSRGAHIPTAFLIIIPVVSWYWTWKFSEGVEQVTSRRMSAPTSFLLLFFLGIIGQAIIQSSLNDSAM